jgi:hypothetical protein
LLGVAAWLGALLVTGCAAAPQPSSRHSGWQGSPPDCWSTARNYQTDGDDWNWPSRTKIERVATARPDVLTLSPNGAYYFALSQAQADLSLLVFAGKDHSVRISFAGSKDPPQVQWINERLLYVRIWWGRVAATDLIFNVESERVVHAESVHDGGNAMEQSRESCPLLGGCQCIPQRPALIRSIQQTLLPALDPAAPNVTLSAWLAALGGVPPTALAWEINDCGEGGDGRPAPTCVEGRVSFGADRSATISVAVATAGGRSGGSPSIFMMFTREGQMVEFANSTRALEMLVAKWRK